MNKLSTLKAVILITLFSSCFNKTENLQKLDAWENILKAVEKKDKEYLLKISSDTLQCIECNNGRSWINKEAFFKDNFNQMEIGKDIKYSYFKEDISDLNNGFKQRIRISYNKEHKGNKYDVIYTFLKNEDTIKFLGVFSIP